MSNTETLDQRIYSRLNIDVPVDVEVTGRAPFPARCLDLSSHGVKLRSPFALSIGTRASLSVQATQPGVIDFIVEIEVQRLDKADSDWEIGAHVLDIR